ncbi:MAG: hypothetical protein KDJ77_13975 [Rhodobiaceae bacterium]|nr:hypothetical protein [Rhodobiaceae bacterium]
MIRFVTIAAVAIAIAAAAGLYKVKIRTAELGERVQSVTAEIEKEEEAIAVLKAEWSLLNQPDRLQALAERFLELKPMGLDQLVEVDGLSEFLTPPSQTADIAPSTVSSKY